MLYNTQSPIENLNFGSRNKFTAVYLTNMAMVTPLCCHPRESGDPAAAFYSAGTPPLAVGTRHAEPQRALTPRASP